MDAFEALFREQYPRLVALGAAMTGNIETGHDLAQETMARAYDRWDAVQGYEHQPAWLRRVLTNLVIDRHRSATAESAALVRLERQPDLDNAAFTEWQHMVAELDRRQRIVVTLFYGEDRSLDDIADVLGVPPGTVKSTLWRARQRLRDVHGQEARDA